MRFLSRTAGALAAGLALLTLANTPLLAQAQDHKEEDFLSRLRQLTLDGKRSGEGYFSPDGKSIVFQSEREPQNPFYQIYLMDLESGDAQRLSPGWGKTTCSFFRPGSSEVLFASTHLDPNARQKQQTELDFRASGKERRYAWDYDDHMDIFVSHRDGTPLQRLTDAEGYDAEASYSPDGQKIVFTSLRDAYPREKLSPTERKQLEVDPSYFGEIYTMNSDGSAQTRLTFTPGYDGGPFFSPDGQRIIWRRFETNGVIADVFSMRTDGTDVRQLTRFGCLSWAPFFHPSGKYFIFTCNKLGFSNFELFLTDADGKHQPVRVTYSDGFDGLPTFSPDGNTLCWTAQRSGETSSQLFLASWNHQAALAALESAPLRQNSESPTSPNESVAKLSPSDAIIRAQDLKTSVRYLASDELQGRMTGSPGARAAADYIADTFAKVGVKKLPALDSYFENFEFNAGARVLTSENRLAIIRGQDAAVAFEPEKDFRPLPFTANGDVEGEVVFAGYGLTIPGKQGEGYDSYASLNVTNKVVLVLRYAPEKVEPHRRQELNRYAGLRYKAMIAREHGAKAILTVTGPNSPNPGELAPFSFDSSAAASGIAAVSISGAVAEGLLQSSGKTLSALQTALDTENPHADHTGSLGGARIRLSSAVEHLKKSDRNVIGMLPPTSPGNSNYVLICAHYDHLGFGETGAMLRAGEENKIHPGADDNASGVATVLALAKSFAAERQQKPDEAQNGLLFALWSGEELGLIGSAHFAASPPLPLSNLVACVNFDMVGRLRDNKLILQGIGSSTNWRRLIEKRNVPAGFNLSLQNDPYLPTDVTSFYPKQVAVLNFFTGSHEDYHRPTDRAELIDFDGMERIAQFAKSIVRDLSNPANHLNYAKVEGNGMASGQRENLRAYLGTIPDYATEVVGVKLSGVRGGSPAERAGLQSGDVIVELGGQQIKNIYDYTFALDAVRIGQPTPMVIQRGPNRQTVQITPETRK